MVESLVDVSLADGVMRIVLNRPAKRNALTRELIGQLQAAVDKAKAEEASKQLRATCEGALPLFPTQSAWEENVEVIFVALVVALGLRAYIVQPFRIPTGSMQPTLNGITIEPNKGNDFKKPWLGQQAMLSDVLSNDLTNPLVFVVVGAASVILAVALVRATAGLLIRERIIFGR